MAYLIWREYPPRPAANGPQPLRVKLALFLVLTHGVRVAPLVTVPGSKSAPGMDTAPSSGTLQPLSKIQGNITTLYTNT